MELKDVIKDYKYRFQLTNDEIAKRLGVTKSTVSRWISGDVKRIQDETLQRLNDLLGYDMEPIIKGSSVHLKRPILGYAKAGYNMYAQENYMGEEEVTEEDFYKGDFFLQIEGDSMIGSGIMDGDLALIKQCSSVSSGEIAVVMIGDDEVTIKKVIRKPDMLILEASNPHVENRYFSKQEVETLPIRIIGKVVYTKTYF
ncbi:LexA family protein [Candidatus Stoquefichus sp. SB1]|jgi:repressor LexA|uniref:LexA family protein n=1 Tax=Candidatus Stoquefichus sp. SB1 TaxID=1658109 RepID=UPI00067E9728|nr:S24 family peptidase [Candidatus Stoquefichus sp. SB1]